jgi:hypothetical protein
MMNENALIEAIAGNLDLAYRQSQKEKTSLATYLDKMKARDPHHPSCYTRLLTDIDGNAMSLDHYEELMRAAERYVSRKQADDTEAYAIDQLHDTESWSMDDTEARDVSKSRITNVVTWIKASRARIVRCRADGQSSLPSPIQYVGYAFNAGKRQKAYEDRTPTSWLSDLIIDICELLWPRRYSLKFFVLCLVYDCALGLFIEHISPASFAQKLCTAGCMSTWRARLQKALSLTWILPGRPKKNSGRAIGNESTRTPNSSPMRP